jgi:hypothetical protein
VPSPSPHFQIDCNCTTAITTAKPHRPAPFLALGLLATHHVGSLSSPIGPHRRRRDPQCLEQNRFGTKTAHPRPADSSRELQQSICVLVVSPGRGTPPIGTLADELTV